MTIWRMRVACCMSKATRTQAHAYAQTPHARTHAHTRMHVRAQTNMYYFLLSHGKKANAPECYTYFAALVYSTCTRHLGVWPRAT